MRSLHFTGEPTDEFLDFMAATGAKYGLFEEPPGQTSLRVKTKTGELVVNPGDTLRYGADFSKED